MTLLDRAGSLSPTSARVRPEEAIMLCDFIERTTQLNPHAKPGPQLASLAQAIFAVDTAAIFDADLREVYTAGESLDSLHDILQSIHLFETSSDDPQSGLIRRVLHMGQLPIGALLLRGEVSPRIATAIAAAIAITFDRYHAFASESRTETARQTEQMRTTVLDNLAHAYKTPLTAIEAASSGLAEMGNLTPSQSNLVSLISEQADQLSQLTTRLLKTARLEASALVLHTQLVAVAPLIDDVLASLRPQLAPFTVKVSLSRDDLSLLCDRQLLVAMLTQYIENASKYADTGTTITVQAMQKPGAVLFSVRSFGVIIPAADLERIFDRFYRSSIHRKTAPGTGIGLSIVKRAAQAHGGHVWATSDARKGTIFNASLPIHPQGGHPA